uniref:Diacylglycerol kinase n=2 Tax=Parascaris univalens TaxID=6257 RepID=A0A915BKE9_PARUN
MHFSRRSTISNQNVSIAFNNWLFLDSNRKLQDMLIEFQPDGVFYQYLSEDEQTINFAGFKHFLTTYFDAELPASLMQQLFLSFAQKALTATRKSSSERRGSMLEEAISSMRLAFHDNLCTLGEKLERLTTSRENLRSSGTKEQPSDQRIPLKPLVCYLSLLEGAPPEDKLEFVFHLYDSDSNGYLDHGEMECIIEQMMNVAKYQHWDTVELEHILRQMMREIDFDSDGIVSLDEWKRGGLTTIPLLVLLGFDTEMKEDGTHIWKLRHFSKPTYCNVCMNLLVGWGGKQGLSCALCKYTVHERCVRSAVNNCIKTYCANRSTDSQMLHHWIESNSTGKCSKCHSTVSIFQGKRCRWCHNLLHEKCLSQWPSECNLGALAYHILPPTNIMPSFLDRKQQQSHLTNNLLQAFGTLCSTRPLLVLINPKSGGKQGERIYRKFQYLLNPRQVYDLIKDGPERGLQLFSTIENANVLVCGGDGTVGWVLDAMDKMNYGDKRPAVAVLPLGTGNDLARCLRWGGGYENESLHKILQRIERSTRVYMDRWQIKIEQSLQTDKGDPPPFHIINNYFSIGVDASIAHRFHVMREKYPEKFNSRMRNKLWYFELGTSETLSSTCKNLHEQIDIFCDGETLDLGGGPTLEGIALLNIGSIYGGSNLWGTGRKTFSSWHLPIFFPHISDNSIQLQHRVQDIGDHLIEVVGLESAMQMGQIKAGVRGAARRLSQCSTVVIQTHKPFPMQIDGEPWMQPPCVIQITHKNQVPMLVGVRKRSTWYKLRRQARKDS